MSTVSARPAQDRNSSGEAVYRTSQRQRALSALCAAAVVLLVGSELTSDDPLGTWGQLVNLAVLGTVLLSGAHGFLAKIEISEGTLRKRRPL